MEKILMKRDFCSCLDNFSKRLPIKNFLLLLKSLGYKYSPCLLERLESQLILKEVATVLYRRKISPVFKVHDSIVVLLEFAEEAEQIMSDTIFGKTGLRPKIQKEVWE